MTIIPPYLKPGDTIGIVCPAGYMPYERAATCIEVLQQWGYQVKVGKTLGNQHHYFSGTDEERLNDLQQMIDDDAVNAILCGRGGYGVGRIIDQLKFDKLLHNPKWIIGFSDITVLHSCLHSRFHISSIHGPMAGAFNDEEYNNEYVQSLKSALTGNKATYTCDTHQYNKTGTATGGIVGGNLALLANQVGTSTDIDTTGKILFIEDVGEYIYNVDRMLYQLKRAGKLNALAGLIVGGFTDMKDTQIPFGKEVYEVINDLVKDFTYPIAFQFPISHNKENYAVKIGVQYSLTVGEDKVILKEQ